jgi:hypothetical protein
MMILSSSYKLYKRSGILSLRDLVLDNDECLGDKGSIYTVELEDMIMLYAFLGIFDSIHWLHIHSLQ